MTVDLYGCQDIAGMNEPVINITGYDARHNSPSPDASNLTANLRLETCPTYVSVMKVKKRQEILFLRYNPEDYQKNCPVTNEYAARY